MGIDLEEYEKTGEAKIIAIDESDITGPRPPKMVAKVAEEEKMYLLILKCPLNKNQSKTPNLYRSARQLVWLHHQRRWKFRTSAKPAPRFRFCQLSYYKRPR